MRLKIGEDVVIAARHDCGRGKHRGYPVQVERYRPRNAAMEGRAELIAEQRGRSARAIMPGKCPGKSRPEPLAL